MRPTHREATTPAEMLAAEWPDITWTEWPLTQAGAYQLAQLTGTSPEFWLNLQRAAE